MYCTSRNGRGREAPGLNGGSTSTGLTSQPDLAEVIAEKSRYAVAAVPVVNTGRSVRFGDKSLSSVSVQGSSADYPRVFSVEIATGRFYSDIEDRSGRNVCVIGASVAEQLFPIEEPIGKQIRVAGVRFQVIGVIAKERIQR